MRLVLVGDQPEIDSVAQQVEKGAAAEWLPAEDLAIAGRALLRVYAFDFQAALQRMDRAELEVGLENVSNDAVARDIYLKIHAPAADAAIHACHRST